MKRLGIALIFALALPTAVACGDDETSADDTVGTDDEADAGTDDGTDDTDEGPTDTDDGPIDTDDTDDGTDDTDDGPLPDAGPDPVVDSGVPEPMDPDSAEMAEIDRFSEAAGTLMVRSDENGLPEADEPIDFDVAPFITQGLGPNGEHVEYYNFDVQPTVPAPIYVLQREGEAAPVDGQLNIVDVIPGDEGYNDFWQVVFVTVPEDYVANTITSYEELDAGDFGMEGTEVIVNCPIVPAGSTAMLRYGNDDTGLHRGWYDGMVVSYFNFSEASLMGTAVPVSPIYVTFNVNPDQEGGGPGSGFVTEDGTSQTHNVVATLPEDEDYSPLWLVNVYDNADFEGVSDLEAAMAANILATGVATVNCPIATVMDAPAMPVDPDTAEMAAIDRFSEAAGTLMVRNEENGLPEADEPIDFDVAPFITQGLGPNGEHVEYYNFDVQPTVPAPIYVLQREGEAAPVDGQLNIVDVIPGDEGYNDFWQVVFVTVPEDYVANTITSYEELDAGDFGMEGTEVIVNCPIVPAGSTAMLRYGNDDTGLHRGWYDGMVVSYFNFSEASLMGTAVPVSPIYVTFNVNPDQEGGGPGSGFVMEEGTSQTHNVVATLPEDEDYSPLWLVNVYDNADFEGVSDLEAAMAANILATGVATVNCPIATVME